MIGDERSPEDRAISHDEPDDLQYIIHHAELPETGFSRRIDGAARWFGQWISYFWVLLMAVICMNVFMKNVLSQGSVQLEEIQWHIYSALFLLGLSYTMALDDHVRVDLFHEAMSLRTRAWVDFFGILLLLVPFLLMVLYFAFPFVLKAYADGERSVSPAGLPHYWIIKSSLLIGLLMLLITALSRLHRCIAFLFLGARPTPETAG